MLNLTDAELLEFFTQFAFDPLKAYGIIVFFIFACSVILPFPEELLVLGAGLIAHAGRVGDGQSEAVSPVTMSVVCFFAVFLSDVLVYYMGKFAGGRIIQTKFFQLRFAGKKYDRINQWFTRYGGWAAGLFRFTPGLRFPGHLFCGFMRMSLFKFVLADSIACLIFIPPQILLISYYGREILWVLSRIQSSLFSILLFLFGAYLLVWLIRRLRQT